ncbi:hypothetical protein [Pseudooceanicola nitratireducens]|uniref:hypothetical protein n=1 Tax=Pseudooceanicola nitratireducens TaxID=517719 RepID=UPI001C9510D2|nr:hypothetical protein [Pseudooceanicola nitratireducens]MBY6158865.1 hypothetical protein [Pseudooceanicola nitratireducens]
MSGVSSTEIFAGLVLAVTTAKAFWDFVVSPSIYRKESAEADGFQKIEFVERKRSRDTRTNVGVFLILTTISALTLIDAVGKGNASKENMDDLEERILNLERKMQKKFQAGEENE